MDVPQLNKFSFKIIEIITNLQIVIILVQHFLFLRLNLFINSLLKIVIYVYYVYDRSIINFNRV